MKIFKKLGYILILLIIILLSIMFFKSLNKDYINFPNNGSIDTSDFLILEGIIKEELKIAKTKYGTFELPNGSVCQNYTDYYTKVFKQKYPYLDLSYPEKPFYACDGLKNNIPYKDVYCDNGLHTFLIVGGYGGYCILDQRQYTCIRLVK